MNWLDSFTKPLSLDGRLSLSGLICPRHVKEDAGGIFDPLTANGYGDLAACCLVGVGEGGAVQSPSPRLAKQQAAEPSLSSPAWGEEQRS
jgi:hypothetical protein